MERNFQHAVNRAVHSSQRLVNDYVDLAKYKAQRDVGHALKMTVGISVAVVFSLAGWIFLMMTVMSLLTRSMSFAAAAALVGFGHLSIGAIALRIGLGNETDQERGEDWVRDKPQDWGNGNA